MSKFRIPALSNPNVVIRLTEDPREIAAANQLIFKNYVSAGFWQNHAKHLENEFLHTPMRHTVVALLEDRVFGTISLIIDSTLGLPSDGPQPDLMQKLRSQGGILAEISGFAVEQSDETDRNIALFLLSYAFRYSFYYSGVDRLAASCIPAHAEFYESFGCSRMSGPTSYATAGGGVPSFYLVTLAFNQMQSAASGQLPSSIGRRSLSSFMFSEPHACQQFPLVEQTRRPREIRGPMHALQRVA